MNELECFFTYCLCAIHEISHFFDYQFIDIYRQKSYHINKEYRKTF